MVAAAVLAPSALAQEKVDFDAAALFASSCAPCHGPAGEGGGPVASALKHEPKPLSGIAAAHGGTFPADDVYNMIDGRILVDAHGPRDMPVWGKYIVVMQKTGDGSKPTLEVRESSTATIVKALVEYVRTLQKAP